MPNYIILFFDPEYQSDIKNVKEHIIYNAPSPHAAMVQFLLFGINKYTVEAIMHIVIDNFGKYGEFSEYLSREAEFLEQEAKTSDPTETIFHFEQLLHGTISGRFTVYDTAQYFLNIAKEEVAFAIRELPEPDYVEDLMEQMQRNFSI